MTEKVSLAIIGGSGLYSMPGLTETTEHDLLTPFGKPFQRLLLGH
jgi:5'-methylthioadenosine phosphorylase